jgi:hypothetical protein
MYQTKSKCCQSSVNLPKKFHSVDIIAVILINDHIFWYYLYTRHMMLYYTNYGFVPWLFIDSPTSSRQTPYLYTLHTMSYYDNYDFIPPLFIDGPTSSRQTPFVVTADSLSQYTIHDVILPLPGYDVKYPNNAGTSHCRQRK